MIPAHKSAYGWEGEGGGREALVGHPALPAIQTGNLILNHPVPNLAASPRIAGHLGAVHMPQLVPQVAVRSKDRS